MAVRVWKEDMGTEARAMTATEKVEQQAKLDFETAIDEWWQKVLEEAKYLCAMMAYDTGTLHDTIRIVKGEPGIGFFEITAGPAGVTVDRMLMAGGLLINPKSGRICDYASAVHEGYHTRSGTFIPGKPFLTMALDEMEPELMMIMNKFMDKQLTTWARD